MPTIDRFREFILEELSLAGLDAFEPLDLETEARIREVLEHFRQMDDDALLEQASALETYTAGRLRAEPDTFRAILLTILTLAELSSPTDPEMPV